MTIADMLTRKGLLAAEQLADAQSLTQAEGLRLDRPLAQKGLLTEKQLLEVLSEQLHLPLVTLEDRVFDGELLRSLPPRVVYRQRLGRSGAWMASCRWRRATRLTSMPSMTCACSPA